MGNSIRDQIRLIIENNVRVRRLMYDNGEFVFAYDGLTVAANQIMEVFYDRLETIDCE